MHAPALMTLPAPPLPSAEAEGDLSPGVAGLVMKEVLSNDFTIASYVHTTTQDAIRVSWTNAYTAFPGVPASRRRVEATFATDLALGDWSYLTNQVPRFPNLTSAASVDFRIPSALLPPGAGSSGFFGFAPWLDPDLDTLGTLEELLIYRTDPFRRDTDGDSFSDGDEVRVGEGSVRSCGRELPDGALPRVVSRRLSGRPCGGDERGRVRFARPRRSGRLEPVLHGRRLPGCGRLQ